MNDQIIVIGHKSPDTDTVVSAMAAAAFYNATDSKNDYVAKTTGSLNSETQFVLDKFELDSPEILESFNGEKVVLVDHNESSQTVEGEKDVIAIIDHHKLNFSTENPIEIMMKPWGCTATILYERFKKNAITIPQELKGPMLCAILSDTVITKSPTTTAKDIEVIEALSKELNLDYKELGMEMFKAKAKVADKTPEEIIRNDFKDFDMNGKKIGIGQIETPDLSELQTKVSDIIGAMKILQTSENYDAILLMMTDIIEEGTQLLIVSEDNGTEIASFFETKIENNVTPVIPGMMSRKKQVSPVLTEKFA